jgi:putative ABC transport system permease protein
MRLTLAAASLRRHRTRTLLAILGVAVSAALLLDMVMLAGGMRESFGELLMVRGYQLRLAPKGTLPFDSEASIAGAAELVAALRAEPRIEAVSPVFGGQLHVLGGAASDDPGSAPPRAVAFALGIEPSVQGDYELESGADIARPDQLVANAQFLRAARVRVGDTLEVAAGFDPQLRAYAGQRRMVVVGAARFFYTPGEQSVVAVPLATLQALRGAEGADRVSLIMARVRDGASVEETRVALERAMPRVSAISTATALAQVEQRLSYFRQLAFILGAISLVIGFLLVTTLVTVSVNERIGEIAVLRAIGVSRAHVVQQIVIEGAALSLSGAALGMALGLVTARYLNAILSDFPGLPAAFRFFVFQPAAAWQALGLLVLSGVAAGIYPSWRAASLPIAGTLREEAVG